MKKQRINLSFSLLLSFFMIVGCSSKPSSSSAKESQSESSTSLSSVTSSSSKSSSDRTSKSSSSSSSSFSSISSSEAGSSDTSSYQPNIATREELPISEQAEENVITIEEEGLVLLKNEDDTLPLSPQGSDDKIKVNIFGACAYGLLYGNGGSGSFQTDGRVSSFPRHALKLEQALENEGFEINQNLFNMILRGSIT